MAGNTKLKAVVDSSIVISFLLNEEGKDAETIFHKFTSGEMVLIAPKILCFEVGNVLRTRVLQDKLMPKKALSIFQVFFNLYIEIHEISYAQTLKFAIQKNLSFYDASYVFLAKSQNISLLTLDKKLLSLTG